MNIPLPFSASLERYSGSGEDELGNEVEGWATPVSVPSFWWSPSSEELALAGHDRVIVDLVMVVDSTILIGPKDRVTVESKLFEVVGHPLDYDHGPFGYSPRRKPVNLKRVEG